MARSKNIRNLSFKPIVQSLIPENIEVQGTTLLLHEEIEAIYLMDVLGLYQEDAAKSMEISRPTFTRILKNARQKVAKALVSGYKIQIEDTKIEKTIIAFCCDNQLQPKQLDPLQQYILIYELNNNDINLVKAIDNPLLLKKLKPASALPKILIDNHVNIFLSSKIGEGLKHSLISKGIQVRLIDTIQVNKLKDIIQ